MGIKPEPQVELRSGLIRSASWALMLGALVCSSACFLWTSRSEGDEFKQRLTDLEAGLLKERHELEARMLEAQEKVVQLEQLLERATRLISSEKADTEIRVQELETQNATTQGQVAELRNTLDQLKEGVMADSKRLEQIAQRVGVDAPLQAQDIPSNKEAHFAAAIAAFNDKDYATSRSLLREYLRRYKNDARADEAHYWIAMGYLRQERPATALGEFRAVISEHPKSSVVDDTLFHMAAAFWQLHACTDAKNALQALLKQFKKSPLADQARAELKRIAKAPKGYCTS